MSGAIARIILRYGVGAVIGMEAAQALAGDPDIVLALAGAVGVAIEAAYTIAKRRGWAL